MNKTSIPGEKVVSPCNSICALNEEDVCVGCYRTASEISRWGRMSADEQRLVVVDALLRSRKENPFA